MSLAKQLAILLAFVAPQRAAWAAAPAGDDAILPIMAWDYADDEPTLKAMADCGINLVAFVPPEALDVCERVGIKAIVYADGVTPNWDKPFKFDEASQTLGDLITRTTTNTLPSTAITSRTNPTPASSPSWLRPSRS
jgi:hypothetical protein